MTDRISDKFSQTSQTGPQSERPYTVAVFAASSMMTDPAHAQDAAYVGKVLAEKGFRLAYGGGSMGLMGVVSQAALDAGGDIVGYTLSCFNEDGHDYPQKRFEQSCLHVAERKQRMLQAADAYIALGAGFGTLDEVIEAGNEQYTGSYMNPPVPVKPIILINRNGMYDPFIAQIDKMIAEGAAKPKIKAFFTLVRDGREAVDLLERMKQAPAAGLDPVNRGPDPQ